MTQRSIAPDVLPLVENLRGDFAQALRYETARSDTEVSTSSATLQTHLSLPVNGGASVEAGDYRVGWGWVIRCDNMNGIWIFDPAIVQGPIFLAPSGVPFRESPASVAADRRLLRYGFRDVAWAGGVMTLRNQFAHASGPGNTIIYRSQVEIWKI